MRPQLTHLAPQLDAHGLWLSLFVSSLTGTALDGAVQGMADGAHDRLSSTLEAAEELQVDPRSGAGGLS